MKENNPYELYDLKGLHSATQKITAAIKQSAKNTLVMTRSGVPLEQAMRHMLHTHVKPVLVSLKEFGAQDTEPGWKCVDTLVREVEAKIGTKVVVCKSDLRGAL